MLSASEFWSEEYRSCGPLELLLARRAGDAKLSIDRLLDLLPKRVPFWTLRAAGLEFRELSLEEMCRFLAGAFLPPLAGMLELVALRTGPAPWPFVADGAIALGLRGSRYRGRTSPSLAAAAFGFPWADFDSTVEAATVIGFLWVTGGASDCVRR